MEDSFIAALKSMLTIQRWNLQPKIETWVEAENAVAVAHLAYCIAKEKEDEISDKQINHLLFRILLKSLNKHYTTDISHFVTDELKGDHELIWEKVVNKYAGKIAKLLPRDISTLLGKYLVYEGDYGSRPENDEDADADEYGFPYITKEQRFRFEKIILFCQNRLAIQEIEASAKVYPEYYKEIEKKCNAIRSECPEYNEIVEENKEYFRTITRLKYIRRWNTTNRFIPSSVLGHTYVVAILSIVLSLYEGKNEPFIREALLRAMFHDVPESMTGDIITPVKEELKIYKKDLVSEIEKKLTKEKFIDKAPKGIKEILGSADSPDSPLRDLSNKDVKSAISLVMDCDRLALMVECLNEKEAKVEISEMEETYLKYYRELSNSEWPTVRQFLGTLADRWLNARIK